MVKCISSFISRVVNPSFLQPEHLSYTKEIPIKNKNSPVPYQQKISQGFGKTFKKLNYLLSRLYETQVLIQLFDKIISLKIW
jgi:hypothetical protein